MKTTIRMEMIKDKQINRNKTPKTANVEEDVEKLGPLNVKWYSCCGK